MGGISLSLCAFFSLLTHTHTPKLASPPVPNTYPDSRGTALCQLFQSLGACVMTTDFLDNKICTFKTLLSWHLPRKNSVFGQFSSMPPMPPPPQNGNFIFIVLSPSLKVVKKRLPQKSEGDFSEQSPGWILRGISWRMSLGLFPWKNKRKKSTQKSTDLNIQIGIWSFAAKIHTARIWP